MGQARIITMSPYPPAPWSADPQPAPARARARRVSRPARPAAGARQDRARRPAERNGRSATGSVPWPSPRMRPHRRLVGRSGDLPGQRLHPERCRHPALYRPRLRRPHVAHAMHGELGQRGAHRRPIAAPTYNAQACGYRALHAAMYLRWAQPQRAAEGRVSPSTSGMGRHLEQDEKILGLQLHGFIPYSGIWNIRHLDGLCK